MWILYFVVVAFVLAGCGLARQQEQQARIASLKQQASEADQECNAKYPADDPKIALARARCHVAAANILRPVMTHPDLFDVLSTSRVAIAEQVLNGQITIAQANQLIAEKRAAVAAEAERRNLVRRSVASQEAANNAAAQAAYLEMAARGFEMMANSGR